LSKDEQKYYSPSRFVAESSIGSMTCFWKP